MKKLTLIAAGALSLVAAPAMAQSTVTLYGIADIGYNRVSGLKNGTVNTIASGIGSGSRFGLRGTEDLGGGYKAIFVLENRLELDTGSVTNAPNSFPNLPDRFSSAALLGLPSKLQPNLTSLATGFGRNVGVNVDGNLFDRQAYTGLVTPIGAFTLGRQYTPAFVVATTFDTTQADTALAAGQVVGFPGGVEIRLSNTVQYAISQNGFTGLLMYGAGEVAGNSSAGRFYGVGGLYKGTGFSVGAAYNRGNNTLGEKALTSAVVGGTFDIGPGTLFGQYDIIKNENPQNFVAISAAAGGFAAFVEAAPLVQNAYKQAFRQDGNLVHVGYKLTSGANTVAVTYSRYNDKLPANADVTSYGVAYYYALSKRTQLQAVVSRFNNKGLAQAAPGGGGFLGGFTGSAGQDSTGLALGIRHTF